MSAATLPVHEAADLLGVSRWTLSRKMDEGTVPYVQLGPNGRRRIPVAWLCDTLGVDTLPTTSTPTTKENTPR